MKKIIITKTILKKWALNPDNKEAAKALGMIIFKNQHLKTEEEVDNLAKENNLSPFQTAACKWGLKNKTKATMLFIALAPQLK